MESAQEKSALESALAVIDARLLMLEAIMSDTSGPGGIADRVDRWAEGTQSALGEKLTDAAVSRFDPALPVRRSSVWNQPKPPAHITRAGRCREFLLALRKDLELDPEAFLRPVGSPPAGAQNQVVDRRKVFVVHGRNSRARDGMFVFLRSIGLQPIEWSEAVAMTGKGAPYIGEVLDAALAVAQAIVVLMTPDEVAYLRPEYASPDETAEKEPAPQARPNVLFEAGLAMGRSPDRTILVELGKVRPFSDIGGRHVLRLSSEPGNRKQLADRLRTAGCAVETPGTDWLTTGDLDPPPPPGGGLPLGRRLPSPAPSSAVRIEAEYVRRGHGDGILRLTNCSSFAVHDLRFDIPPEAATSFHVLDSGELPIAKLPSGKTASFPTSRTLGPGASHFEITVTGKTPEGEAFETKAFINLVG